MRTRFAALIWALVVVSQPLPAEEPPRIAGDFGMVLRFNDGSPVWPDKTLSGAMLTQFGISVSPYIYVVHWLAAGVEGEIGLGTNLIFDYTLDLCARVVARLDLRWVVIEALYGRSRSGIAWGLPGYSSSSWFASHDIGARISIGSRSVGRLSVALIRSTPVASGASSFYQKPILLLEIGGVKEGALNDSQLGMN